MVRIFIIIIIMAIIYGVVRLILNHLDAKFWKGKVASVSRLIHELETIPTKEECEKEKWETFKKTAKRKLELLREVREERRILMPVHEKDLKNDLLIIEQILKTKLGFEMMVEESRD